MPISDSVPRPSPATPRRARTAARTTSAARRCAARRAARTCWRSPSRPSAGRARRRSCTASTKNSPRSRLCATRPGPSGIDDARDEVRQQRDRRGEREDAAVGARPGRRPPSARTSRRRRPAAPSRGTRRRTSARAGPACAPSPCARVWPTSSGSARKATSTTSEPQRHVPPDHYDSPPSSAPAVTGSCAQSGSGTPGGMHRRAARSRLRVGLARLLGPGPGLGDPGGEHEVLAQRLRPRSRPAAAAAPGRGWPAKSMPNISWVSRSCHDAPRKTPVAVASDRGVARHPGAQQHVVGGVRRCRRGGDHREAVLELVDRGQAVEERQPQRRRARRSAPRPSGRRRRRPSPGRSLVDARHRRTAPSASALGAAGGRRHGRAPGRRRRGRRAATAGAAGGAAVGRRR